MEQTDDSNHGKKDENDSYSNIEHKITPAQSMRRGDCVTELFFECRKQSAYTVAFFPGYAQILASHMTVI